MARSAARVHMAGLRPRPGLRLLVGSLLVLSAAALGMPSADAGGQRATPTAPAPTCVQLQSVSDRCPEWTSTFDHDTTGPELSIDLTADAVLSPDGARVFMTGRSNDDDSGGDFATLAYDASTGARLWTARYDRPGAGDEFPNDLVLSPDGSRVYVTGTADSGVGSSGDSRFATVAYDAATGQELWVATRDGLTVGNDRSEAVSPSPDGELVYVTGSSPGEGGDLDIVTVAYNATDGTEVWAARHDGISGFGDTPVGIQVSPDGRRVYIVGNENVNPPTQGTSLDFVAIAYEASDPERLGQPLWVSRYDGPGQAFDVPTAVGLSPNGSRLFIAGVSERSVGARDFATVAYETTSGEQAWVSRFEGPQTDWPHALAVAPSGESIYVTGRSFNGDASSYDFATVAYDSATGEQKWVSQFATPGPLIDRATAIAVSPGGEHVYVAGSSALADSGSGCAIGDSYNCLGKRNLAGLVTVAYAANTGAQTWMGRVQGTTATETGSAAAVLVGSGSVLVAGSFERLFALSNTGVEDAGNYSDYVLLSYPS